MATKQGGLALLYDPVAQELLHSTIPARLAYVWRDGTPRVVPIWFHWNGTEVVLGTPLTAPKVQALSHNPKVVLTIDSLTGPIRFCRFGGQPKSKRCRGWCQSMRRQRSGTLARSKGGPGWSKCVPSFHAWLGLLCDPHGWVSWILRPAFQAPLPPRCLGPKPQECSRGKLSVGVGSSVVAHVGRANIPTKPAPISDEPTEGEQHGRP